MSLADWQEFMFWVINAPEGPGKNIMASYIYNRLIWHETKWKMINSKDEHIWMSTKINFQKDLYTKELALA